MGDVVFCRIDEEITKINTNNDNNENIININTNSNKNEFIKTDDILSANKDLTDKDENNTKEIIININNPNKNGTKLLTKEKELKTRNEKEYNNFINYDEVQSTDNHSLMNGKSRIKDFPKIRKLLEMANENICCISLFDDILNFSIGDYQLIHCEKISKFKGKVLSTALNYTEYNIYASEQSHNDYCEYSNCLMSRNNFLIFYSCYCDFNWPLRINKIRYDNINLQTYDVVTGSLDMSNYNIPFDFDGNKFLYIEFINESIRTINIYKTLKMKKIFSYLLDNGFGHISHMKLLPNDDCIFLCRNIYVCEIYKYKRNNKLYNKHNSININIKENNDENDFCLLTTWVHHENIEIISSNVYISGYKISVEYNNDKIKKNYGKSKTENIKNSQNKNEKEKEKDIKLYLNYKNKIKNETQDKNNSSIDSYSSKNKILDGYVQRNNDILNYGNEIKNHKNNNEIESKDELIQRKIQKKDSLKVNYNESDNTSFSNKVEYYIITLDITGNFNIFINKEKNNGIKKTLFNLYKIENIEQEYKNLKFFSIGFPYYITINEYYYVITTDHGVFVISKINNE